MNSTGGLRRISNITAILLALWLGFLANGQTYVFDNAQPVLPHFMKAVVPMFGVMGVFVAYAFRRKVGAGVIVLGAIAGVGGFFALDSDLSWWFEPYLVKVVIPMVVVAIMLVLSERPSSSNAA
jgi:hypothetical protein